MKLKKHLVIPFVYIGLSIPFATWAAFPGAGVDRTTSLGKFGIRLNQEMGQQLGLGNNCPFEAQCFFESPVLIDSKTLIGRSEPHKDADSTDINGAEVCIDGDPTSCNTYATDLVKDADFTEVPDTGKFNEGPNGTQLEVQEIHTQIIQFNMTRHEKQDDRCPNSSASAVRAGSAAPNQPRSIGEVESKGTTDFPAESFFNVFVEVDIDWDMDLGVDITVFNKTPLVIQNDNLDKLPPQVVYKHDGGDNHPAVYDKNTGKHIGWVTLAGHGVGFNCGDAIQFQNIWQGMLQTEKDQLTKLEPVKKECEGGATYTASDGVLDLPFVDMVTVPILGGFGRPVLKEIIVPVKGHLKMIPNTTLFEIMDMELASPAPINPSVPPCHASYDLDGKLKVPLVNMPVVTVINGIPVTVGKEHFKATLEKIQSSDLFRIVKVRQVP